MRYQPNVSLLALVEKPLGLQLLKVMLARLKFNDGGLDVYLAFQARLRDGNRKQFSTREVAGGRFR